MHSARSRVGVPTGDCQRMELRIEVLTEIHDFPTSAIGRRLHLKMSLFHGWWIWRYDGGEVGKNFDVEMLA